jgi:phage terminase large subunit GpA-like protein
MSTSFKISLAVLVISMYLVGYIAWRVQNDALKQGYNRISAAFWSIAVFFFSPIALPLYMIFRKKTEPEVEIESAIQKARRKLFITCPYCGEENPPELMKCQKCEKPLVSESKPIGRKACVYCGESNDVNAAYCANCRQKI